MNPRLRHFLQTALQLAAKAAKITPNDVDDLIIAALIDLLSDDLMLQAMVAAHAEKMIVAEHDQSKLLPMPRLK
mgnify:CR=1 FL=1